MRQRKETLRSVSKVSNEKLERVRTKKKTYCGTILVALNPYRRVHDMYYTQAVTKQYTRKVIGEEAEKERRKEGIISRKN